MKNENSTLPATVLTVPSSSLQNVAAAAPARALVLANAPKLSTGDDKAVAKELGKRFIKAQTGMRDILALGIFACQIKDTQLKHGQFGKWLAAHAPKLCRPHSTSGILQTSHALESYMAMTRAVLESHKLTVTQYCEQIAKSPRGGICMDGKLLTLPESKVPEPLRPLRSDLIKAVEGKTQRQVMMDFNQVEEDGDGIKKKHGRLKGKGGASAAQRAAAKAKEAALQIEGMESDAANFDAWMMEVSEVEKLPKINDAAWAKHREAIETHLDFIRKVDAARAAARKGGAA